MKRLVLVLCSELLLSLIRGTAVSAQTFEQHASAAANRDGGPSAGKVDLTSATIADLNSAFAGGALTSKKLTEFYFARIAEYDKKGPAINAVLYLNPNAMAEARALDAERKAHKSADRCTASP